jgi:hypothetical protein
MKNFDFSKYCTPAQLYLVLGAIGIIGTLFKNYGIWTLLTQALFLVIWAWVLNWLCSKGFKAISWILVLLPFIMALFAYFFIRDVAVKEGLLTPAGLDIKAAIAKEQEKQSRKKLCSGCSSKGGRGAKGAEVSKKRADCRAKYCN